MRKPILSRVLLICNLCLCISNARAQYVAIPDSNFGTWLYSHGYSSCLIGTATSGYRLDTLCSILNSKDTVICQNSNIHDLTGIQYFRNLKYLDCGENDLTDIPVMSDSVNFLYCSANSLASLPILPLSLRYLYCDSNQLTTLPGLPSTLLDLECNLNHLSVLPVLPAGLNRLGCHDNLLTSLPNLPVAIIDVQCFNNQLSSLPAFPASLTGIDCHNNLISLIPALPAGMIYLFCDQNPISSLPALPSGLQFLECSACYNIGSIPALPASLIRLLCWSDSLYTLPELPPHLQELWCGNNMLTSLPVLPASLTTLSCLENQLTSLPFLPQSLGYLDCSRMPGLTCLPRIYQNNLNTFYIWGSGISCMPNAFTAQTYDLNPDTMPLCTPASGCDFYYNVAGNVHYDNAGSCTLDSISPGQPITNMKVQLLQNNKVVQQFYTFSSGGYSFKADSLVPYTVSIDTTSLPIAVVCPLSNQLTVPLSIADSVKQNENFAMSCTDMDTCYYGVLDIASPLIHPFRNNILTTVDISAGNLAKVRYNAFCGENWSGSVTIVYTGPVQYAGPAPGAISPTYVSGDTLVYDMTDMDSLGLGSLNVIFSTDSGAVVGTPVSITVMTQAGPSGLNQFCRDLMTVDFVIHDPHDPNLKQVSPLDTVQTGGWLTYTLGFQNTGNDTAYTVTVMDTLSQYVDASSFQYLGSSNKAVIQIAGNAIVFTFPKINLVDSATNPALSQGWVEYRVKASAGLPTGTQIKNTAFIYFDANPAVVTNTTINTVDSVTSPLGIKPFDLSNTISIYPNPNKGSFTLQTSGSAGTNYTISDMLGNVVMQQSITADRQAIYLPDAAEGVYTLSVKGAQPIRFVVVR